MSLINYEINLILTWLADRAILATTGATKCAINDTKLYLPVVTFSTQGNAKLQEQDWSIFQRAKRLFALSFENAADRTSHAGCFLSKV